MLRERSFSQTQKADTLVRKANTIRNPRTEQGVHLSQPDLEDRTTVYPVRNTARGSVKDIVSKPENAGSNNF